MGIAAFFCIYLAWPWGGFQNLYALMPFEMDKPYKPYTVDHVVFQMQLLFAAIFAFTLLKRFKLYPAERRAEILDVDWTYRKMGLNIAKWGSAMWDRLSMQTSRLNKRWIGATGRRLYQTFSPAGAASEAKPSGIAAILTAGLLFVVLMLEYFAG